MSNYAVIIVICLEVLKFKYVNKYMLIYVKILKSSNCLDILHTWMPICPLYTSCKYFYNLITILHFRAKHRISKFCKQTQLNEKKDSMGNKADIHKILQDH